MFQNNSGTLQNMLGSVVPSTGNMGQVGVPGPFPYPPSYEMTYGYPTQYSGIYQAPNPPGMPMMYGGYPQYQYGPPPGTVTRFTAPDGTPVELEYKPEYAGSIHQEMPKETYVEVPGAPINPDLAAMPIRVSDDVPPIGRFVNVPQSVPSYTDKLKSKLDETPAVAPYPYSGNPYNPYNPYQNVIQQQQYNIPQQPRSTVVGVVNYYNGQPVHPYAETGWYGTPSHPFEQTTDPLTSGYYSRYQRFPGAVPTREQQNMANIAAYHGMTYDEYINQVSTAYQLMSRCCSKWLGLSEEETERRANAWKVKYPGQDTDDVSDTTFYYPSWAFDSNGNFTKEYVEEFMINKEFKKKISNLKIVVKRTNPDGTVEELVNTAKNKKVNPMKMRYSKRKELLDGIERAEVINKSREEYRQRLFAEMHNRAPEREFDNTNYNAFEIVGRVLNKVHAQEIQDAYRDYKYSYRIQTYNHNNYKSTIMGLFKQAKAARKEQERRQWSKLIDKVVPDDQLPAIRAEMERRKEEGRPFFIDGDWVIAKPGRDIVGLPLDVSVAKIIRMNTVTGEEEIFDPDKPEGYYIREQIAEAVKHPNFTSSDEEVFKVKSLRYKNTGWES